MKGGLTMTNEEKNLFDMLRKEFGGELAEIIITLIILGHSVDSAIQSALELY